MRKFFQFIAFIVCLTMMLSILTACSSGESTQNENVVTFTDALGREVTVSKEPQRVATLIGSFADVWMLAGGSVCATAEDAWEDFGLELPNAVNIGGAVARADGDAHGVSLREVVIRGILNDTRHDAVDVDGKQAVLRSLFYGKGNADGLVLLVLRKNLALLGFEQCLLRGDLNATFSTPCGEYHGVVIQYIPGRKFDLDGLAG